MNHDGAPATLTRSRTWAWIHRGRYLACKVAARCLDLLGPVTDKAMANKRAHMKTWPILFVCQATGALHQELLHNYGTEALLLQWARFTSIQGTLAMVVSDQGKQLTSSSNTAAFNAKELPDAWNWDEMKQTGARAGTSWEFVPAGCHFRNGLAKARMRAIKRTITHML